MSGIHLIAKTWQMMLLIAVSGCGPMTEDAPATDALTINGLIDSSAYHAFLDYRDRHKSRPLIVRVRSPGGLSDWAMALGDAMLDQDVELRLFGMCHSACMQYLVPSARRVIVAPRTSVAFHSSPSDYQLPPNAPIYVKSQFAAFRAEEVAFYKRRHVDADRMKALRATLEPICYLVVRGRPKTSVEAYGMAYRTTVAIPSQNILRMIGYLNVQGYWPDRLETARRDADRAGFNQRMTMHYVTNLHAYRGSPIFPAYKDIGVHPYGFAN